MKIWLKKFHLKGGYGDLIADEAKYEEFVCPLKSWIWVLFNVLYRTFKILSRYFISIRWEKKKLEFCTSMYIITLEEKKNKNKVLGIRDVVNLDFEV